MIGNNRISAVLVSTNLEQCRDFYERKVGLKLSPATIKNHLLFECGDGTTLLVYGRGKGNSADHTQVRFWSNDVHKDVAELVGRGVVFEEYDYPEFKTVNGIVNFGDSRGAWFKDSEGNILALNESR